MKQKEQKQKEAVERNEKYAGMTIDQKIERQTRGGYKGKQLRKLLEKKAKG